MFVAPEGLPMVRTESSNQSAFTRPRRGLRREDAAFYVGVSPSTFDKWVEDGTMPRLIRRGGVGLWDTRLIDRAAKSSRAMRKTRTRGLV